LAVGGLMALSSLGNRGCQRVAVRPPVAAARPAVHAPAPPPVAKAAPSGRTAAAVTPTMPAADPIAALIAQSEQDFQAGTTLDQAGRLDAARAAFDRAVDRLLTSSYIIAEQPRLQQELDHLVDRIHALEMDALAQGQGLTEQAPTPAPIEAVAQLTFPVDPATRAEVESKIKVTSGDLPLMLTDPVISYVHYLSTRGRSYLQSSFRRAGRYRPMIQRIFREEGVPQDLIYLAQAESGFDPHSYSSAGATGIWQFVPSRAEDFDLKRTRWQDDRRDPEKSTRAAARHLKQLYGEFGDWYLAMAAYNSGPGTVEHAVARTGSADFWELQRRDVLPRDTRNYVPIILAMALIAKNPQQYGINHLVEDPPEETQTVVLEHPLDLRLAADCAAVSVAEMQSLNPSLLQLETPPGGDFPLHLPAGSARRFAANLARVPPQHRLLWRFHLLRAGETLTEVAHRFHSEPGAILAASHLAGEASLTAGAPLTIPVVPERAPAAEHRYRVRPGDTWLRIARLLHVPEARLRELNPHARLIAGHLLTLRLPGRAPAKGRGAGRSVRPRRRRRRR